MTEWEPVARDVEDDPPLLLDDALAALAAREPWRAHAACLGEDTAIFFDADRYDEAKAVCGRCPVRGDCADAALRNHDSGVWGGFVFQQGASSAYRRARRRAA